MPRPLETSTIDPALVAQAADIMDEAGKNRLSIVTAESCTGGLVAVVLSDAPGAARSFKGGFVTYTSDQKSRVLGIPADMLKNYGAVSREVACFMANAALDHADADLSVAVTGVAGPKADEDGNPVGRVHVAGARRGVGALHRSLELGDLGRAEIKNRSVEAALALLRELLAEKSPGQAKRG
jgi:nicotinamide-nucleotide amidase